MIEKEKNNQAIPRKLQGADAGNLVASSSHESLSIVGFNTLDADRLGLKKGDMVQVAPEDTGKTPSHLLAFAEYITSLARNFPALGKIVALNEEEVIIQVQGQAGMLHAHFPRLGFSIKPVATASL